MALAATLVAACADDNIKDVTTPVEELSTLDSRLIIFDDHGNRLTSTSASSGKYTGYVNVEGKWKIISNEGAIAVFPKEGEGPTPMTVLIGENWGEERNLDVQLLAEGKDDLSSQVVIVQNANPELDEVSKIFSSNKGAGYSYLPNTDYCLGVNLQLFNLHSLDMLQREKHVSFILDDIYPVSQQELIFSNSEKDLNRQLSVSASLGLDYTAFSLEVSGSYGSNESESTKTQYALKRLKTYQFTREIHYMNIMSFAEKNVEEADKYFSPGFIYYQNQLKEDIAAAGKDPDKIKKACRDFVTALGPCFINKSVMGNTLDYQISIDESKLVNGMDVKGALDLNVKAKIHVEGEGEFTHQDTITMKNTTAKLSVRGGDVEMVSILTHGGSLNNDSVAKWQMGCKPRKAVLVDMNLMPIYVLIPDLETRQHLKNYFDTVLFPKKEETASTTL